MMPPQADIEFMTEASKRLRAMLPASVVIALSKFKRELDQAAGWRPGQ
jgi:hypothetical protein